MWTNGTKHLLRDSFLYLGQNFANSESCPILRLLQEAKICYLSNLSKNGHVWATQWPTSGELKIKFDPSLDRPRCESFKMIKIMVQKNPPPGCNLGPKFLPHVGRSQKNFLQQFHPYIKKFMYCGTQNWLYVQQNV